MFLQGSTVAAGVKGSRSCSFVSILIGNVFVSFLTSRCIKMFNSIPGRTFPLPVNPAHSNRIYVTLPSLSLLLFSVAQGVLLLFCLSVLLLTTALPRQGRSLQQGRPAVLCIHS